MTQIDFYLLSDPDAQRYLCRLAEKIYRLGHRIYIHTDTPQQAMLLDELLWRHDPASFLPHAVLEQADTVEDYPVLLGHADDPRIPADVMINLASEVAPFFSRFERVVELVANDDTLKQAARQRYKFYRERGYTLNTHNL